MKLVALPIFRTVALALMISAFIFIGFAIKPAAAVTTTSTNLESQMAMIQKLLEQIQLLQKQLLAMQGGGSSNVQKNTCLMLNTNLGYRSADSFSNNEVSALQDFLQAKGHLNSAPTGFYGMMTTEAVKSFQAQNGIEATGYLGNETRAKIKTITCLQPGATPPIACTMDAMMCPDGSSVGRVAPSCNFAACPKTTVALPVPKITSTEFWQGSEVGDVPFVRVWGSNLGNVVKLEYRATSEQPTQTVDGSLNTGSIGKDTYASFNLDTHLGNAMITSLKVRVVDSQGQASTWKTVAVENKQSSPIAIELFSTKGPNSAGAMTFVWRTSIEADSVSLDVACESGSVSLKTSQGNYPSCEKGGVWTWWNRSSDSIEVSTIGNNEPVTLDFTLTAVKAGKQPVQLAESVTFPATSNGNAQGVVFNQNLSSLSAGQTLSGTVTGHASLGFTISDGGDKVWGSGLLDTTSGVWSVTIPNTLMNKQYELHVYSNNVFLFSRTLGVGLKG